MAPLDEPLNILAIDTSTIRAAVAIATTAGSVHVATPDPAVRHGRNLLPSIRDLLQEAQLTPGGLDLVAVGLGPGSYTGLRIGLMAAKTLAYATRTPLVGLDSLEAIAWNVSDGPRQVTVIADAQRGHLYTADFVRSERSGPLVRTSPTQIETIARWSARSIEGTLALGRGIETLQVDFPGMIRTLDAAWNWPDGHRLLDLARSTFESGRRDDPWFLEPHYLRLSAAENQWTEKSNRG